ncbi:hypothetical protein [Streptomyces sp. CB03238]|uniref:hypothetical protein n=1 Tax=Streptomyces sp. CB03238 TaxID=1907777 RepID=UPI000A1106D2|nr:hypothetical protein [Streptomyces sp. CB03238]ORT59281.1 hypothetical protein BKD26_14905 [Streptomyces sp. CB03238]
MITTLPVGGWSWETKTQVSGGDPTTRCAQEALNAWLVLRARGLADNAAQADLTIRAKDGAAVLVSLKRVHVELQSALSRNEMFSDVPTVDWDRVGVVTIDLSVPGTCLRAGEPHHVGKLFTISVDAWASGAGTLTLHTFSDAWMSHNLRGHKQPEVQKENAPRLKSALAAIEDLMAAETIPSDSTSYGIPSKNGFEDLPDEDPDLLDSWYMFEVPRRTDQMLARLPSDAVSYSLETESPVEFVEVAVGDRVIGYLWASDVDDAAGYEPRTPAGDDAVDAGPTWLTRLSDAKNRGLSPTQALRDLSAWPDDSQAGAIVPASLRQASSLEDLQELSGRE